MKAYRFRLYPNKETTNNLNHTFDLCRFVALFLIMTASTVQASSEVSLISNKPSVSIGEQFEVSVIVKPEGYIDTVAIDKMSWDSDVLEFLGMSQGTLFNCSLVWMEGNAGKGNYVGLCWACGTPTNKQGILATFTFKALMDGASEISLGGVGIACAGTTISPITYNCSIAVGSGIKPQDEKAMKIPIYLFASIILVIIVIISILLMKRRGKFPQNPKYPNK